MSSSLPTNWAWAGFIAGADDTTAWEERLEREWWPNLRAGLPVTPEVSDSELNPDQRRIAMIFRPPRTPTQIANRYPAHLHLNLLARLQRNGLGSSLLKICYATTDMPPNASLFPITPLGGVDSW